MMPVARLFPCIVLAAGLLAGCNRAPEQQDVAAATRTAVAIADPSPPAATREAPHFQFSDEDTGIALAPTPGFALRRDFARDDLSGGEWKTSAAPGVRGEPLVALVLDGSDEVTAAELRIGTSEDSHAVVTCLEPPAGAVDGDPDEVRVDGQPFRHFRADDAAMSHYRSVEAYRSVRNGRCIAIDLLVAGTRPEVYDPPRVPPFGRDEAHARLREALGAVRITR